MKKIMKKVLSLMLALVMVVSLAPMIAKANGETVLDTKTVAEVAANGMSEEYYYMPAAAGTYKVTVTGATDFVVSAYVDNPMMSTRFNDVSGTVEFTVTTNPMMPMGIQAISLVVMNNTETTQSYTVTVTTTETGSSGGDADAVEITDTGTDTSPITLNALGAYKVSLDSSGMTFLKWTADAAGTLSITCSSSQGMFQIYSVNGNNVPDGSKAEVETDDVVILQGVGMPSAVLPVTFALSEGSESDGSSSGSGTYMDPYVLTELGEITATVANYSATFFEYTAAEDGTLKVEIDAEKSHELAAVYIELEGSGDIVDGAQGLALKAGETAIIEFTLTNLLHGTGVPVVATATFTEGLASGDVEGSGTEEDPYVMIMGDNTAVLAEPDSYLYYTYTATEKGALTLTMNSSNWFYDGYVNTSDEQFLNPNKSYPTSSNESNDGVNAVKSRTIYLEAGDKVIFRVSTARDEQWARPAGTVEFDASFSAGVESGGGEVEKDDYAVNYDVQLELGENTVELDPSAKTTIFEFEPEEAAVYKFETEEGFLLGYWGSGTFFVSDQTENKTNTLEFNFESVGPSIMVGVTGEGEATITVTKAGEAETKPVIPTIVYENVIVPKDLDITVSLNNEVNVKDDNVKDKAVLGEDGYYHLNSATGPVLFVDFDHSSMSLSAANGYGQLKESVKDDEGKVLAIIDYTLAFGEYYSASQKSGYCYPLTDDLMAILKGVGADKNWYGEDGYIANQYEDEAWMFACCYDDALTTIETELEVVDDGKTTVSIDDSSKITADAMSAIIELNKEEAVVIEVAAGEETVTYEFAAGTLELVDGKETYDFSVELVDDYAKATEDKAAIDKDGFVLRVNFKYEGKLPATATISIPVGTDYASKTLYYYQIQADGTLKYVCDAPVDAKGIAKVTQDYGSDYVLLSAKVADPTPIPPTGTGDATNIALWVAVLGLGVVAIAGSVVMKKREF